MLVERSMHDQFLSNSYLVCDRDSGAAAVIDAGGPVAPLIEAAERWGVTPTHVLLTHHHFDHVAELPVIKQRWANIKVMIHPLERDLVDGVTATIDAGERFTLGGLEVRPLHTPGHTTGMLSFLLAHGRDAAVFTGDTLFRNSVGGVRAPGHGTYQNLKDSIMGTLMELDAATVIYPGHTDSTTVAEEWEHNAFVRVWRGLDREGTDECIALGEPATLVLWAPDYDGGHKAWIRWPDGRDDIVPGSQVQRT